MKIEDRKSCEYRFSLILINCHRFSSIIIDYIEIVNGNRWDTSALRVSNNILSLTYCKFSLRKKKYIVQLKACRNWVERP